MDSIDAVIKKLVDGASSAFEGLAKFVLAVLLGAILFAMGLAVFKLIFSLTTTFEGNIHESLKSVIINSLTILALLEVFRTVRSYFSEGHVKVIYIIDTVLIIVLKEFMEFWFKDIDQGKFFMAIALVLSLVVARILLSGHAKSRNPTTPKARRTQLHQK